MRLTLFTVLLPSFLELDLCELGEYTEGVAKRIGRERRQPQEAGGRGEETKGIFHSSFSISHLSLEPKLERAEGG